jgi:hypothetical protein
MIVFCAKNVYRISYVGHDRTERRLAWTAKLTGILFDAASLSPNLVHTAYRQAVPAAGTLLKQSTTRQF